MSKHGATLQNLNNELIKSLEDMSEKRTCLFDEIKQDEGRKAELEQMIFKIKEELTQVKGKQQSY